MAKLPRVPGAAALRALKLLGFRLIRVKGSHHLLSHSDGRVIVLPVHAGRVVGPGLLNNILKESGVSVEEFRDAL